MDVCVCVCECIRGEKDKWMKDQQTRDSCYRRRENLTIVTPAHIYTIRSTSTSSMAHNHRKERTNQQKYCKNEEKDEKIRTESTRIKNAIKTKQKKKEEKKREQMKKTFSQLTAAAAAIAFALITKTFRAGLSLFCPKYTENVCTVTCSTSFSILFRKYVCVCAVTAVSYYVLHSV